MNLTTLRERIWNSLGLFETDQRPNYMRQEIDDALNFAILDIYQRTHWWWHFLDEVDLDIVAGTSDYELDDYCWLPVALKLQGNDEDFIEFVAPAEADRQGLRQPSLVQSSAGPFQWTWKPSRRTAAKLGNIDIDDGTKDVTINSIDVALTSADVGRRVRINGEQPDYVIATVGSGTCTLDRNYRSPRRLRATDDAGDDRAGVSFEVSPGPVWKVTLSPAPSQNMTVTVRMARRPRWLLHGAEVPEIDEKAHEVLELAARRNLCRFTEDSKNWAIYNGEYEAGIKRLRERNWPVAAPGRVRWHSDILMTRSPLSRYNDVYRRIR